MVPGEGGSSDDPTIPDEAVLWRRIPPWHLVPDHTHGGRTISSSAFENDSDVDPMSAFLADVVGDPAAMLVGHGGYGVAAFTAGLARQLGQRIAHDVAGGGPGHVLVIGKKSHGMRKKLRAGSVWAFRPPDWHDVSLN